MKTLKLVRYISECKGDTMGLFRRIRSSPLSSIEPYRSEIIEALKHAVPKELVPFFLPLKVKAKAAVPVVLANLLIEGYSVYDVLQRARAGKTASHFLVIVTGIRKEIEHLPEMAAEYRELVAHPLYREALAQSERDQLETLRTSEDKEYDTKVFSLSNTMTHINRILEKIETRGLFSPTMEDIMFLYICFAARGGELHLLNIDDEGMIGGQLKTRGKNTRYPYEGLVSIEEARVLLNFVKSSEVFFPTTQKKRSMFNIKLKEKYGVVVRDLREIGANLFASTTTNKIDKILKRSSILRHGDLHTSLFYHHSGLEESQ